jgi:hypothetical protein
VVDRNVLTFHVSKLAQPLRESLSVMPGRG